MLVVRWGCIYKPAFFMGQLWMCPRTSLALEMAGGFFFWIFWLSGVSWLSCQTCEWQTLCSWLVDCSHKNDSFPAWKFTKVITLESEQWKTFALFWITDCSWDSYSIKKAKFGIRNMSDALYVLNSEGSISVCTYSQRPNIVSCVSKSGHSSVSFRPL